VGSENQKSHCQTRAALTCQVIIELMLLYFHNSLNLGRLDLHCISPEAYQFCLGEN
jgi:hypothetical protein